MFNILVEIKKPERIELSGLRCLQGFDRLDPRFTAQLAAVLVH
jgi:hypothetical protein